MPFTYGAGSLGVGSVFDVRFGLQSVSEVFVILLNLLTLLHGCPGPPQQCQEHHVEGSILLKGARLVLLLWLDVSAHSWRPLCCTLKALLAAAR
jgi:hypothetical protein